MLIATLSQLLTFADLGAGAAVATTAARIRLDPDGVERFRRTLLTAIRTVTGCALVLGAVAVVVGLLGNWSGLLGIDGATGGFPSPEAATVLALLAFAASLPFALGEPILRGSGRHHWAVLLAGVSAPSALFFTLILSAAAVPPYGYALALPLGALFGAVCCAAVARRTLGALFHGLGRQLLHPRRFPGRAIAATAVPWFVVMVGLPVALQSDRIIISHRLSGTDLSEYSYVAQLYMPLWSVVSVAALALWPMFATGTASHVDLRRAWVKAVLLLSAGGVVLALAFLVLAGPLVAWMSNGTASASLPLLFSFVALLVVQSVHVGSGMLLISPRQLKFQAACVLALVVTNLPLSWVLAPAIGPAGPVLASAVTVAVCQLLPGIVAARRASAAPRPGPSGGRAPAEVPS
jgi:O-antigen/teichoic acid export membrane protein